MKTRNRTPTRVRRTDSIPVDKTYFTAEGYLVDHPILTSIGVVAKNKDAAYYTVPSSRPKATCRSSGTLALTQILHGEELDIAENMDESAHGERMKKITPPERTRNKYSLS